jgi:hypothetical protein
MSLPINQDKPLALLKWDPLYQKTNGTVIHSALASSINTFFLSQLWSNPGYPEVDVSEALKVTTASTLEEGGAQKMCATIMAFFEQFAQEHFDYSTYNEGLQTMHRVKNVRCEVRDQSPRDAILSFDVLELKPFLLEGQQYTYFKLERTSSRRIELDAGSWVEKKEVPKGLQKAAGYKGQLNVLEDYDQTQLNHIFKADILKV